MKALRLRANTGATTLGASVDTTDTTAEVAETTINWSPDAPRGGRAVLNRILKENAAVPVFRYSSRRR